MVARRHHPDVEHPAGDRHEQRAAERRARQRERRETGRAHDGQLAVGRETLIDELDDDEGGDRQDHRDEAGDQEAGELEEGPQRQSAIDDQLDEAERLGEPDQRRERRRRREEGNHELTEHVAVETGRAPPGRGNVVGHRAARFPPAIAVRADTIAVTPMSTTPAAPSAEAVRRSYGCRSHPLKRRVAHLARDAEPDGSVDPAAGLRPLSRGRAATADGRRCRARSSRDRRGRPAGCRGRRALSGWG